MIKKNPTQTLIGDLSYVVLNSEMYYLHQGVWKPELSNLEEKSFHSFHFNSLERIFPVL